jgi:hypothetical protein
MIDIYHGDPMVANNLVTNIFEVAKTGNFRATGKLIVPSPRQVLA